MRLKTISALLLLMISVIAASQNRDTIYLDKNDKPLNKLEFKRKWVPGIVIGQTVNGPHVTEKIHDQQNYGLLTATQRHSLYLEIEKLALKPLDTSKILVIEFFDRDGVCWEKKPTGGQRNWVMGNYESYYKTLKKRPDTEMYFVSGSTDNWFVPKDAPLLEDRNNYFKNSFFEYIFGCGSVLVVHPSGNFYLQYGEHRTDAIIKIVEIMSEMK